jgi:hypothetical protein
MTKRRRRKRRRRRRQRRRSNEAVKEEEGEGDGVEGKETAGLLLTAKKREAKMKVRK